jgi:hypothetical protein
MSDEWIIDVCRTCGREAKIPFCGHRPTTYKGQLDATPWCEPVRVAPTSKRGRELAALQRAVKS